MKERDDSLIVIRSARRKKTISARLVNGRVEVRLPAGMTAQEEEQWIARMVARLRQRAPHRGSDAELLRRARLLNERHLDGRADLRAARYVTNMRLRWGSATPATGTIRISAELRSFPAWVEDYVIVHELCHLIQPDHSPAFWKLCHRYPLTERARGYLIARAEMEREGSPDADA